MHVLHRAHPRPRRALMTRISALAALGALTLALNVAVGSEAAQRVPAGLPASAALLLRYDADHDGVVTKAEMEAGLKADFAAADTNGDGCLDPSEVRAENLARSTRDGAQASPLLDWNLDGCVDAQILFRPRRQDHGRQGFHFARPLRAAGATNWSRGSRWGGLSGVENADPDQSEHGLAQLWPSGFTSLTSAFPAAPRPAKTCLEIWLVIRAP